MTKEEYSLFSNYLLTDFSFLDGRGFQHTDDERFTCMDDLYIYKYIEWINVDCLAIKVDGKIVMIVDP